MNQSIKSIQSEYVYIFENAFSDKYKNAFNKLDMNELKRFILKEVTASQDLDFQLNRLLIDLNSFWDRNKNKLIDEIRKSRSYRILLPIQRFGYNMPENLRSLGIYFDSVLMVDPLHFPSMDMLTPHLLLPPNHEQIRGRRLVLLEHASNIFKTLSFMRLEEDHPLFLIIPDLLNFDIERNEEESAAFLSQLFSFGKTMSHDELFDFLDNVKGGDVKLRKMISDNELLTKLTSNFQNVGDVVWVMNFDTKEYSVSKSKLESFGLATTIRTLAGKVESAIYAQRSSQVSASILQVDPVIYSNHLFLHDWIVKRLINDYENHRIYSTEEQAIAMGLTSKDVNFLTALSDTDLKKIREKGKLESLRNQLRLSRSNLQDSSIDNLKKSSIDFSQNLIEVVSDYGKTYKNKLSINKKNKFKSAAIFTGTATLGVASLILPQYAALSMAATGIGITLGGTSLKDIYLDTKSNKKEITQLEQNPISLLYGASLKKISNI